VDSFNRMAAPSASASPAASVAWVEPRSKLIDWVLFLHDGRTSNLVEAIKAHKSHDSEANKVIDRFNRLNAREQQISSTSCGRCSLGVIWTASRLKTFLRRSYSRTDDHQITNKTSWAFSRMWL